MGPYSANKKLLLPAFVGSSSDSTCACHAAALKAWTRLLCSAMARCHRSSSSCSVRRSISRITSDRSRRASCSDAVAAGRPLRYPSRNAASRPRHSLASTPRGLWSPSISAPTLARHSDQKRASCQSCRRAGDLWELCSAMWVNQFANLALCRLDEAAHVAQELIPLATRLGQSGALSFGMGGRGYRELMLNGDIALFEGLTKEDLEFCRSAGLAGTSHTYSCLGLVAFWRGDWEAALRRFEEAVAVELPGAFFGADRPWVFLAKAYAGDRIGALAALRQKARILPAGGTWRQKISSAIGLVRAAKASRFNGRMLWRMISRPGWTTM